MDEIYFLDFQGEGFEFFRSSDPIDSEKCLIAEMENSNRPKRIHSFELQLNYIFERFDSINHRSDRWQDNLKTLLAHGFDIVTSSNRVLDKSFTPVRFFLIARNPQNAVHFGFFFTENKQDVAERFIEFCKATEYPPGIHGHIIELVLTTCGGSLFAIEAQTITTLIQLAPSIGLLTGDDAVIRYLTKPRQF